MRMWNAEHFQFFPVALVASGVLAFNRRSAVVRNATLPRADVLWVGMLIIFLTLALAVILGLALTGWLSLLGFLALMIYASYGRGGVFAALPIFILLAAIKPLPTGLEQSLTINMQEIASEFAGSILNLLGVMHYRTGVVLVLVGKSFMAEEACSGIRSLFSSLVAVIFLGFMNQYHWLRHILNVLQTIVWVVIFNAMRIAIVVYAEERFSFSIAEGWKHELFGFIVFFLIFATVLSTDRLLAAIVPPKSEELQEDPPGMPTRWSDTLVWPGSPTSGIALAIAFALITLLSLRMLFMVPDYKEGFAQRFEPAEREYLPPQIGDWTVTLYRHVNRPDHDLQGSDSFIWELTKDKYSILVSLDGSFNDFHDLSWCYTALGWSCTSNRFYSTIEERASGIQNLEGELTRLDLSKTTGENGVVYFSAIDKRGEIVVPPPQFGQETRIFITQAVFSALRFAVGQQSPQDLRSTTFVAPVSTVQLVYTPPEPIDEEEKAELEKLFLEIRGTFQKSPRFVRSQVN